MAVIVFLDRPSKFTILPAWQEVNDSNMTDRNPYQQVIWAGDRLYGGEWPVWLAPSFSK